MTRKQQRLETYQAKQSGYANQETTLNKIRKYSDLIDYYADLTEQEAIEYQRHYQTKEGYIMGIDNTFKKQGIGQDEQGEKNMTGYVALLSRLLRHKFGLQPEVETVLQQLPDMEKSALENLADALLNFKSISDLQNWINQSSAGMDVIFNAQMSDDGWITLNNDIIRCRLKRIDDSSFLN